ncbi:MAG: rRNA methyltransferase [Phycisphaerales bacterium]|nr:rRNA methyltransferase [Phycisphaerales bacterium]
MPPEVMSLIRHGGVLQLGRVGDGVGQGVGVDFGEISLRGLRSMPLMRACGKICGTLLDCTAGLGGDSWLLAAAGWRVLAVERSPLVHAVLADGLERAKGDPVLGEIASRIDLRCMDAREFGNEEQPAVIYMDPMYPHKLKSALSPKPIRWVRLAVGDDPDAADLLDRVRTSCASRVVVKRPLGAPPLRDGVHHRTEGKLARFDVYMDDGGRA